MWVSAVFTPQQRNFSLQQMETATEKQNQSKYRVVEPSPNGYIYKISPQWSLKGYHRSSWWKDCKNQWVRDFAVIVSSSNVWNYAHNSHRYDCLNMSWTKMAPMDMSKWARKSPWRPQHYVRITGSWAKREVVFPREEHTNRLSSDTLSLYIQIHVCKQE